MDIVERYLHAIEFWLPKAQRRDIIAEISEDLHSKIEEESGLLGRDLTREELEKLLQQRGSPLIVANYYLPQRYLIGPVLFPVYLFVLKMYALVVLPIVFMSLLLGHMGNVVGTLWTTAFTAFGTITAAFAILQRAEQRSGFLHRWNVKKLPPFRNANEIPRSSSALELAFNFAILIWWCRNAAGPVEVFGFDIHLRPLWICFFCGFIVTTVAGGILSFVNFSRPYWSKSRSASRLLIDITGGVLLLWLLKADVIASIHVSGASALRDAQLRDGLQTWFSILFPYMVAVVAVIICVDIYRLFRKGRRPPLLQTATS